MKKIFIYMFSVVSFLSLTTACNDFGDVNEDKENPNKDNMDFAYVFTQVQGQLAGSDWDMWRNGCIYSLNMIQQSSSVNWSQGVFYTYSDGYSSAFWGGFYGGGRGPIRNIISVLSEWKGDTNKAYEYQYARVMKAYMLQRMTDLYGDVPYSEAGLGESANILNPKYDSQKDIYNNLLKELDEVNSALKALPVSTKAMDFDVFFNGNSERWRKFANSLMLRVAMRLSKVDKATAIEYTKKAMENGLMTSANEDAVYIREGAIVTNDSANPFGKIIGQEDTQAFYVSQFFVDELKGNKDPRLHLIATRVTTPSTKWSDGGSYDYGYSNILDSIHGLPIGYTSSTNTWSIYKAPGFPYAHEFDWSADKKRTDWRPYYALFNRTTFARPDVPSFFVTYPENCLLLADAAVNGIIAGGVATAKEYFKKGVEAAMQQYSYYPAAKNLYSSYLSAADISAYIADRSAAFDINPLKEINWEYYVLTLGDPYETFANWRRSGYPEITSVYAAPHNRPSYPNSKSTDIPRRFIYPTSEVNVNGVNYDAAVKNLDNGDTFSSRVWWDAK